jgi:hypothetical protein
MHVGFRGSYGQREGAGKDYHHPMDESTPLVKKGPADGKINSSKNVGYAIAILGAMLLIFSSFTQVSLQFVTYALSTHA